jgi:hypothetical protein
VSIEEVEHELSIPPAPQEHGNGKWPCMPARMKAANDITKPSPTVATERGHAIERLDAIEPSGVVHGSATVAATIESVCPRVRDVVDRRV